MKSLTYKLPVKPATKKKIYQENVVKQVILRGDTVTYVVEKKKSKK